MLCSCSPRAGTCVVLCVLGLTCLCETATAQPSSDRARFLRWMYRDALALTRTIDERTPLYVASAAAFLLPLSHFDPAINPAIQQRYRGRFGDFLDFANHFGGPGVKLPAVAVFAASLLTRDTHLQDAAFTSLQSLIYAGAISYGLKYAFGRERPFEGDGAHDFDPFSGHTSFPSGHTTAAFALLTPWVLYYPHPVTYGLFALSTGTALARLARDKHWATDVIAGGAIGFLTAYHLSKRHLAERRRLSITPVIAPDALSMSLRLVL
ncbi:MAG: hypothetical protein KatS3mg044_1008 [Rhodothermaceae bacterium]|nr:MAG: hypothetical protein KatS3mg044_1008 [Rhodothermaceae bacterium]